jgi:hypothetical protein
VNEVAAQTSAPRLAGVVALVDRFFPILWIGIYLLLPVSGWAAEMFSSWFDQRRDLGALRSLLADGRADAIADSVIGPAYIGAAALVHEVTGLSPEDSLVALTRASYVLAVAAGLLLVRALLGRLGSVPPMVSLASQLVFVALVFAAGTWYWSDVPWSHFFAAFLAVAVYGARFVPSRPTVATAAAVGALLALLAATRSFELVAVVLAWGIVAGGLLLGRRAGDRVVELRHVLTGAGAFAVTTAVVYAGTGKRDLFFLYGDHLDRQSGSVSGAQVAETPTLSLGLVPTKLIQLFFDPCYLSLCETSDYATGGGDGSNLDLWSLPLAVQLPALLLLPFCIVGVGVLAVRLVRRHVGLDVRGVRPLAEMTVAATGLVVGYAGSTLTGPSHLRYGFARDFLLPALLTAIVAVVLGSRVVWTSLDRSGRRVSPEIVYVGLALVVAVGVVAATTAGRSAGLPRLESRHLGSVTYTAKCTGGQACRISLRTTTTSGDPISIRPASSLTFGCGSDAPRFSVYAASLDEPVRVGSGCARPRLVSAWPTVMGLPPGSFELAAVGVRNV